MTKLITFVTLRPAFVLAVSAIAATLSLIFTLSWIDSDTTPVLVVLCVIPFPVVLLVGGKALRWEGPYAFYVGLLIFVLLCASFRIRDIDDKSIDLQIFIKLLCIGLMIGLSVSAFALRPPPHTVRDLAAWLLSVSYLLAMAAVSVHPIVSVIEIISNVSAFVYLMSLERRLGPDKIISLLIATCSLLCYFSVLAYFLNHELGRMSDWVNGEFVATSRLTGVFGTANAAGAAAALGLLLTFWFSGLNWRQPVFYLTISPMAFCLIASNNRMSIAAMSCGLIFKFISSGRVAAKLVFCALILSLACVLVLGSGDDVLVALSRSGSADEITSGTGRTRIWSVVIDLWLQQPIFGYGLGSEKYILPTHPLLFKAAAHAHNLYLNILFSSGVVGFLLFCMCLASAARKAIAINERRLIGLIIFFLFYGITEPTIGGLVSFISLVVFAIPLLLSRWLSQNAHYV